MVKCDVCGVGEASYVCHRCGARVCADCFDPASWLCSRCYASTQRVKPTRRLEAPSRLPTLMLLAGFSLIAVGVILFFLLPFIATGGEVVGGGVVFIGPLPIVFGAGGGWPLAIAIALLIALVLVAFLSLRLLS